MRGLERSSRARHLLGVRCSAPDSHLRSSSAWTQERVALRKPALPRPGCTRPRGSLQCSRLAGRCATGASRPRAACGAGVRPLTLVLRHARCPLHFAPLLGAPQGTPDSCDPASCLAFEASFLFEVLGQDRERSVGSGASSALRTRRDHVEPSLLGCPPRKASGASSALRLLVTSLIRHLLFAAIDCTIEDDEQRSCAMQRSLSPMFAARQRATARGAETL